MKINSLLSKNIQRFELKVTGITNFLALKASYLIENSSF